MNKAKVIAQLRSAKHPSELQGVSSTIKKLHPTDLAEILSELSASIILSLLGQLDPHSRANVFTHLPAERQDLLLQAMSRDVMATLFEHMASDERADVYKRMNDQSRQALLPTLGQTEREDMLRMSSYPEGTVGAEMTSDFVALASDMCVTDALQHIRTTASEKETIYVIYVLDTLQRLIGTLSLRELVLAPEQQTVQDIMRPVPFFAEHMKDHHCILPQPGVKHTI
ncbi:magnesium transporter MgtE N-terminal domain-containing protein [Enterobacteriaceae bacterium C23F]